jgi:hypothetical protein
MEFPAKIVAGNHAVAISTAAGQQASLRRRLFSALLYSGRALYLLSWILVKCRCHLWYNTSHPKF